MSDTILGIENLRKHFGGVKALQGVDMDVNQEEIVGLIGPNGCGKSTTFNTVSGIIPADEGSIKLYGEEITEKQPHEINQLGLSRTFQDTRLWRDLTVIENLLLPPKQQSGSKWWNIFNPSVQQEEAKLIDRAKEVMQLLEIGHMANTYTKELSGGQSKLVDLGRVLMSEPDILLLDEPVAGVAGPLAEKIFHKIMDLRTKEGLSIVIIEHSMEFILRKGIDRIFVMSNGKIIAEGTPKEIQSMKHVQEAYLGI